MGTSKTDKFSEEENQIALIGKALAHPARVAILQHLFKLNACVCGELVEEIGLAQATISQHLKELKTLGLIKGNIEGTKVCYCIDVDKWAEMKATIEPFLNLDLQIKSCC